MRTYSVHIPKVNPCKHLKEAFKKRVIKINIYWPHKKEYPLLNFVHFVDWFYDLSGPPGSSSFIEHVQELNKLILYLVNTKHMYIVSVAFDSPFEDMRLNGSKIHDGIQWWRCGGMEEEKTIRKKRIKFLAGLLGQKVKNTGEYSLDDN